MPTKISSERYKELLESCWGKCRGQYCFYKQYVESKHPDPKVLCQLKCIEIFKWERSEKEGKDIGKQVAEMAWYEDKYAEAFSEVYDPELSISEVYIRTVKRVKEKNESNESNKSNKSNKSNESNESNNQVSS